MRLAVLEMKGMNVSREELESALKKMSCEKDPGQDGIAAEFLTMGGEVMVEWLKRILKLCMNSARVQDHWRAICIVPLYNGEGEKKDCLNYRGIGLLSIPGKVYERLITEMVIVNTESQVGDERDGFRRGRRCVNQVL